MSDKHQKHPAQIDRSDPRYRRYVGTKETMAYIVYDMSQSYNIDGERDSFIRDIFHLDLGFIRLASAINGVWDVVNDLFIGTIVDRTRTRWGKFKPFLLFLAIPGTILSILYWLMPTISTAAGMSSIGKFVMYLFLQIVSEAIGTFQGMAKAGLQATITPFPFDRERLIRIANFASGYLGEKLPSQLFTVIRDPLMRWKPSALPKLYKGFGLFTVIVAGAGAFWFFYICRERVVQSTEKPTIRQSINTVLRNRPILMLTLSEVLNGFSIGAGKDDYLLYVLKNSTLKLICGIPGFFINPISYALVPWFHRRFSDKTLYILGKYNMEVLSLPVFAFGMLPGRKGRMYQSVVPMAVALTLYESAFMVFYGVRSVVPAEMLNECMDYCEWKNGYRGEAMIAIARNLATKTSKIFGDLLNNSLKIWFHFDQYALVQGREQPQQMQFILFAGWTLFSFVTKLPGIIPMLFYNIDPKTKETMYAELHQRREAMVAEADA
ncbi:MAG: MFS transporter [Clostridia bacterium]|nr:MFS transporter [Clostridia bacterium]